MNDRTNNAQREFRQQTDDSYVDLSAQMIHEMGQMPSDFTSQNRNVHVTVLE